jgi:hypothetical protein
VDYKDEPIQFVINPEFFKEMLKHSTTLTFSEGKAKLETKNYSILTALYVSEEEG